MTTRNCAGTSGWEFRTSEKRDLAVSPTKRGKGTTWMVLVDGTGPPLGADLDAASAAEVRLLEARYGRGDTATPTGTPPEAARLIADRGYDSHAIRALLVRRGIEPIIPARANNQWEEIPLVR